MPSVVNLEESTRPWDWLMANRDATHFLVTVVELGALDENSKTESASTEREALGDTTIGKAKLYLLDTSDMEILGEINQGIHARLYT